MDSIDSENINEAEPDFAERKQQALFLSDPAEEVIKELEAENAELKALLRKANEMFTYYISGARWSANDSTKWIHDVKNIIPIIKGAIGDKE